MRIAFLSFVLAAVLSGIACDGGETEVGLDSAEEEPDAEEFGAQVADSIPLEIGTPNAVAFNPVNGSVYVAYSDIDVLSVFDADSLEPITTIDLPAGGYHSVGVNSETGKIYAGNSTAGTISIIGPENDLIIELDAPNGMVNRYTASVVANPSTNKVYVSRMESDTAEYGVTIIDGYTDAVLEEVALVGPAQTMTFDPSTDDLYAVWQSWTQGGGVCPETQRVVRIDSESDELAECFEFGYSSIAVAISTDGNTLYHFEDSYKDPGARSSITTLKIVELATGRSLATAEYTDFTPASILTSPESGRMFILAPRAECCNTTATSQLLAMDGEDIAWQIPLERNPVSFAADAEFGRFYVVTADRTLDVLEP